MFKIIIGIVILVVGIIATFVKYDDKEDKLSGQE